MKTPNNFEKKLEDVLMNLFLKGVDYKDNPNINSYKVRKNAIKAISTLCEEETRKAVYNFHEYAIGKSIIRKEEDQAFNYARLHNALDKYIEELEK